MTIVWVIVGILAAGVLAGWWQDGRTWLRERRR